MRLSYFITGTDTGVGKTFVTSGVARALKNEGFSVGVMKPVETGCASKNSALFPEDAVALKEASGCAAPLDAINPYRFAPPLAPNMAAKMAGVNIDMEVIRENYLKLLDSHDITLVEGAGGILVPVTDDKTISDLIILLNIPVIIIAPSRLGVINHTSLTVEHARSRGMAVKCIILNSQSLAPDDLSRVTNLKEIKRVTGLPAFEVPFMKKKEAPFLEEGGLFASIAKSLI